MGKHRAHVGQAPCPKWASAVPQVGNFRTPNCAQNIKLDGQGSAILKKQNPGKFQ